MGYAAYIGRVGALAVTLGIGVAVGASPGLGWAQTDAGSSANAASDTGSVSTSGNTSNTASDTGAESSTSPASTSDGGTVDATDDSPSDDDDAAPTDPVTEPDQIDEPSDSNTSPAQTQQQPDTNYDSDDDATDGVDDTPHGGDGVVESETHHDSQRNASARLGTQASTDATDIDADDAGFADTTSQSQDLRPATTITPAATTFVLATPTKSAAPQASSTGLVTSVVGMATQLVTNALSAFIGSGPEGPASTPVLWTVLAVARRELDKVVDALTPPAGSTPTGQMLTSAPAETMMTTLAAPTAAPAPGGTPGLLTSVVVVVDSTLQVVVNLLGGLLGGNKAPVTDPKIYEPDPISGVVTGNLNARDPNGDPLTYDVTLAPAKGTLVVNQSTGAFTYTPTPQARAAALATPGPDADRFAIRVRDNHNAATTASFNNVPVTPTNRAPVNGTYTATNPNSNGVVVGLAKATDPDGDTLTFSGSTTTTKRQVTVNLNGTFTYTASPSAQHAAAAGGAAATDSFTIVATDGHGGSLPIDVVVGVHPVNAPPTNGNFHADDPDQNGVVHGTVSATDPDGDHLTYSGSTTSADGSTVSVVNDGDIGRFTYTPSPAARQNAAQNPTFGFTVTADDGHGGSLAIPVTVTVAPATVGTPNVSQPDPSTGAVVVTITPNPGAGPLTTTGVSDPEHGTAVVNADGTVTYTPDPDDRLDAHTTPGPDTDQVDVTVKDGNGATSTVPVTVPIEPLASLPVDTGTRPQWVSFSSDGSRVYIANENADTVSVYDAHTYQQIGAAIPVGDAPVFVATAPDGKIWVSNRGPETDPNLDSVSVYNPASGTSQTITVRDEPIGIAFGPNHTAYVANRGKLNGQGYLSVIDTNTNTVINTIPLNSPVMMAVSPDQTKLYVTNQYSGTITVLDTATLQPIKTIPAQRVTPNPPYPTMIALNADGSRAYVTNQFDDSVQVIDTSNGTVISRIPLGDQTTPVGIALTHDGSRAYVADFSGRSHDDIRQGTVSVVDLATGQVVDTIAVGQGPVGLALNPAGDRLWVANSSGGVTVIPVAPPTVV
jgi:YVTN family beta-propeller protein